MNNDITIIDISKVTKWKDVKRAIKYHYPSDKNNYEGLFKHLAKMKKVRTPKGETIVVSGGYNTKADWFQERKKQIFAELQNGYDQQYYSIFIRKENSDSNWSMSFVKWNTLASIPIDFETLKHFTFYDIIAHFIWEITFYGTEKDSQKMAKELKRRVESIKSGKAKTVPFDKISK